MTTKSISFETNISRLVNEILTLTKNVWTIRVCLSHIVEFCDEQTHSNAEDLDEKWMRRKDYYNQSIGWTIPSWEMLSHIKSIHKQLRAPICDYGSGSGLLTHLLTLMDCDVYGVDLMEGWKNVGKFHQPEVLTNDNELYHVPPNHIFLISWGYIHGKTNPLQDYVDQGGKCIIIVGEDDDGCTYPSYDCLNGATGWTTQVVEVPNFCGIHTKMSINIRS